MRCSAATLGTCFADDSHHAACPGSLRAIGEKFSRIAARAQTQIIAIMQRNPHFRQLNIQSQGQIQKIFFTVFRVRLAELCARKRCGESRGNFRAYFEATAPDSLANGNQQRSRINCKLMPEAFDNPPQNAGERSAPTCVHGRNGSGLRIRDQHRKAVRHLNRESNALLGGYERVATSSRIPLVSRAIYDMKLRRVKLGHGCQMGRR